MASYTTVSALFTAICDAIRAKENSTDSINHQDIPSRITDLPSGGADPIGYFLRHDDMLRYLLMIPSDGYEVEFIVSSTNGGAGSVTWGDGSSDEWDASEFPGDPVKKEFFHAYKSAGLYEVTITAATPTDNNLVINPTTGLGTIIGISLGKQVVNDGQTPASGREFAMGILRVNSPVVTYGTSYQDQALYPSSVMVIGGHKPNVSSNNAINKLYVSDWTSGGSYLLAYCRCLRELFMHNVLTVGNSCCASDTSLETVYMHDDGSNMNTAIQIGASAFNGCTNLKTLVLDVEGFMIPTLESTAFTGSGMEESDAVIYITDNLIWSLKGATNWSAYADKMKPLSEYKGEIYHGEN